MTTDKTLIDKKEIIENFLNEPEHDDKDEYIKKIDQIIPDCAKFFYL